MLAKIGAVWFGLIRSKPTLCIILALLILIPTGILATKVTMQSDYTAYIPRDSQMYKDLVTFDESFASETTIVIIEADSIDTLVSDQNYAALKKVQADVLQTPNVFNVSSAAFLAELLRSSPSQSAKDIIVDPATGNQKERFNSYFFNPKAMRMIVSFRGDLTLKEKDKIDNAIKKSVADAGFQNCTTRVTGASVALGYVQNHLGDALRVVMAVAFILMFLVLAFLFRIRGFFAWRLLALGVVGIGLIYTFGVMGIIDLNVALASMGVFPILLGLGVDYVVQFQNRYDEEVRNGKTADEAGLTAFTHIGPPIIIAVIVGCVAFSTSLFSLTPMVKDFGKMLIIGTLILLIVAPTVAIASLYRRDRNKSPQADAKAEIGPMEKGLQWIAPNVVKFAIPIIVIGIIVTGLGWAVESKIKSTSVTLDFISSKRPEAKDLVQLQHLMGGNSASYTMIEAPDCTDPQVLQWMVDTKQAALAKYSKADGKGLITSVTSIADLMMQVTGGKLPTTSAQAKSLIGILPKQMKANFISPDYTRACVTVGLGTTDQASYYTSEDQVREMFSTPPPTATKIIPYTGVVAMSNQLSRDLEDSRGKMMYIGIGLCLAALLVLFKFNILRVITAALPIGLILGWSSGLTYLMGVKINPVMATMTALILGIGTEFTILLLMRYYEERELGEAPVAAMTTAMTKIGRAIVVSGLMVVIGFGALLFARDFPLLTNFGKLTVIDMAMCVISTLVVLPAIVVTFDIWRWKRAVKETAKS